MATKIPGGWEGFIEGYIKDWYLQISLFLSKTDPTSETSQCMYFRFIIGREKPGEQSEVAQLIQQTLEQERWQREMMEQRYNQYMEEDEEVRPYTHI